MAKSRTGSVLSDIISEKNGKYGSSGHRKEEGEFMLVNYMTEDFQ